MSQNSPVTVEEIFMAAAEHHPGGERDKFAEGQGCRSALDILQLPLIPTYPDL